MDAATFRFLTNSAALVGGLFVLYGAYISLRTAFTLRKKRRKEVRQAGDRALEEIRQQMVAEDIALEERKAIDAFFTSATKIFQEAYDDLYAYITEEEEARKREVEALHREVASLKAALERMNQK
jgi:DNA polymerase III delta prime subunit